MSIKRTSLLSALTLCAAAGCFSSDHNPRDAGGFDAAGPGDDATAGPDGAPAEAASMDSTSVEAAADGPEAGAPDATLPDDASTDSGPADTSADAPSITPDTGSDAAQEATPDVFAEAAPDVMATCGNGVREGSEQCDGTDLGGATCQSVHGGGATGTLACGAGCTFVASSCQYCGDGIVNGTEVCDGTALNFATCASKLTFSTGGTLACAASCQAYDTSGCVCGSGRTMCTNTGTPACIDLANDPLNCGTCGSTCGASSACTFGHCTTALATALTSPLGIALDSTSVYFTNDGDGKVYSVPLAGGTPVNLVTAGQGPSAWGLTLAGGTLFWSTYNDGRMLKVPVTGGAAAVVSMGGQVIEGVTNDGTSVYWADEYAQTIMGVNIGSGLVQTLDPQPDAGTPDGGPVVVSPIPIAVDGSHVYWGNTSGAVGVSSVYQANKDGSNPIALAAGINPVYGLTVDSTNVYFVTPYNNTVYSVPIGGGTVQPLATGESQPMDIASDATSLYWIGTGVIRKMAKTGGAVTTLATCNGNLLAVSPYCGDFRYLALDSTYVYWTDSGTQYGHGAVFRVPKN